MKPMETVHDPARSVVQLSESEAKRLLSAETALNHITEMLGIVAEPDKEGRYDARTLRDQAIDAVERRQLEKGLDKALETSPTILIGSGVSLSLTYPSWCLIDDQDIAQALSRIPRFNGHTRQFYSVAQHCVLASQLVPAEDALAALLHDATKAYIGDMISPLKALLPAYRLIEQRVWVAIAKRFGVDQTLPASVKQADLQLLATERRDLLPASPQEWPCLEGIEPLADPIEPWSSQLAEMAWGLRLEELIAERKEAL